jgi:hypothetical protein
VRRLTILAISLALTLIVPPVASSFRAKTSPQDLAVNVLKWNFDRQFGRVWSALHPRYQRVVPRSFWEACKRSEVEGQLSTITMKSIRAVDSYADTITLPLLGRLHVRAVTLELKYTQASVAGTQTARDTQYFTQVGGEWKGLWDASTYSAYKARRCPK